MGKDILPNRNFFAKMNLANSALAILISSLSFEGVAQNPHDTESPQTGNFSVFTGVSTNGFWDTVNQSDYGEPYRTGGVIGILGLSAPITIGQEQYLLDFRLQRFSQNTAWNDNKPSGEPQYRDGYEHVGMEVLVGYSLPLSELFQLTVLLGGGPSNLEYKTKEVDENNEVRENVEVKHWTLQTEGRYLFPVDLGDFYIAAIGVVKITGILPHDAEAEVDTTKWYVNFPSMPVPSLGLIAGFKF